MSYWTIPQEMQVPTMRRTAQQKRSSLLVNLFLPFSLAVLGIPFYLLAILKVIDLMQ